MGRSSAFFPFETMIRRRAYAHKTTSERCAGFAWCAGLPMHSSEALKKFRRRTTVHNSGQRWTTVDNNLTRQLQESTSSNDQWTPLIDMKRNNVSGRQQVATLECHERNSRARAHFQPTIRSLFFVSVTFPRSDAHTLFPDSVVKF